MCGQCSENICIFSDLPGLQNAHLKCYWQRGWKEEKKLIAGMKPGELSISEECRNAKSSAVLCVLFGMTVPGDLMSAA